MKEKELFYHEFSRGIIAPWYLREDQFDFYELLLREKDPFLEAGRRYGKTTTILVYVFEKLLECPGLVARWCEPWKDQARTIVMPEIMKLQSYCPPDLRAEFKFMDSVYNFKNGSMLYLLGVNNDKGEGARGAGSDIIVADEYRDWRNASYIRKDVLIPQLQKRNPGQFIIASTPPKDLSHDYYQLKAQAISQGRILTRTIEDNRALTKKEIEAEFDRLGGRDSTSARRELLCEIVTDDEALVIPEFKEARDVIEDDTPRPEFFDPYVGMDLGFKDFTGVLFGYYDFKTATLVIEDEVFHNGKSTKETVDACRLKEFSLWGSQPCQCNLYYQTKMRVCQRHGIQPFLRVSDNDLQILFDMNSEHHYQVSATLKDNKDAAINALRLNFGRGGIKIKKRCVNLIYQLKVGIWNEKKTDFNRNETIGHLDLISALIYLNRNIAVNHNPYPEEIPSYADHMILEKAATQEERDILSAFGGDNGF